VTTGGKGPRRRPAKGPDLAKLQDRLNKDEELRERFLEDPTKTLKAEGMQLSREQHRKLEDLVERVKTPGAEVPGAGVAPEDLRAIRITIGVDF
jgi:hypothetical protein